MKAIINGIRYNTENATLIGHTSSGHSANDFKWWEAGLYISPRSKRYFLAGSGGAMTRWAQSIGDGMTGGKGIVPLTKQDALTWAECELTADEVEAGFADEIEDA